MPPFTPQWSLHASVLIGVGLLAGLYFYACYTGERRAPSVESQTPSRPAIEWWQPVCFSAGLLVLLVALNGPIHDLSDRYLFSVHMGQHLLLTLVLPPLLIAGLPGWLVERALGKSDYAVEPPSAERRAAQPTGRPAVLKLARLLTHPVFAGFFFSAILITWHTTGAYDLMMRDHRVHVATHIMFIGAALLLWWPVMNPAPSLPRLSPGLGMLYLVLVQLPMQLLGALITFAERPLYSWYAAAPRTWGLSLLDDQRLGGLLMWIPGNLWIWGAISILFFRWARKEGER